MATTWDNGSTLYTLPNPDKTIEGPTYEYHGSAERMLNGGLRIDTIAPLTATIPMRWSMATAAEMAALRAAFDACGHVSSTLTLEDGEAFTVLAIQNGFKAPKWFSYDDTPYYRVEITFDEIV